MCCYWSHSNCVHIMLWCYVCLILLSAMQLFVPGCTRLTIEGIFNNIWTHNSNKDVPGIKYLRIGGLYGVTREHYEELKSLLGTDDHKLKSCHKPHFYHQGNFYLPYDDDRAIDIEMCPRCEKFRLVYDCPSEGCQVKDKASQVCRACTLCIARCAQCGRCINDNEYEETFCLDLLCSDCFKQHQDRLDKKVDPCGAHGAWWSLDWSCIRDEIGCFYRLCLWYRTKMVLDCLWASTLGHSLFFLLLLCQLSCMGKGIALPKKRKKEKKGKKRKKEENKKRKKKRKMENARLWRQKIVRGRWGSVRADMLGISWQVHVLYSTREFALPSSSWVRFGKLHDRPALKMWD